MGKEHHEPTVPAELPAAETIDPAALLEEWRSGRTDLICVLGPTASGKTRYAVSLARKLNALLASSSEEDGMHPEHGECMNPDPVQCEILSGDSRQVYRGMDIGTGKDLDEYGEIPYHLIDIADAGEKYDIYRYQRDFEAAYRGIVERGNLPILCGGSGLYIEAATCGYNLPDVPPNPALRERLEKESTEDLVTLLASMKKLHNTTDYDTRKRLVRALEIAFYEKEHPVRRTSYLPKNTFYIGTLVTREERNARIDRRLDARLEEGMVEEIRSLLGKVTPEDLMYYGLEYKFVTSYVCGKTGYDEMRTGLATAIHQFAKRQMTWFRGMERKGIRIHWTTV